MSRPAWVLGIGMTLWLGVDLMQLRPAGGQERTNRFYRGTRQDNPIPQTQRATSAPQQPGAPALTQEALLKQVEKAIDCTSRRQYTAGEYTPWQVVHGILALRQGFMMKTKDGGHISGIDWMASGALFRGEPIFEATPYGGRGHPFTKPYAFEGHPTQFMGYMAMSDLPLDFQFQAGDKKITVADIINDAKMQVRQGPEITWTLWALAHYLDPATEWKNNVGEAWSIERLVQIQTQESVLSGACGGTHGLFAMTYARNRMISLRRPLRGVWVEAEQKIQRFINEAKALQNTDGSFSSAYFAGPQHSTVFATRLPANGHILEWLMVALSERQLNEPWVSRGVASVSQDLIDNRLQPVDVGPLCHALHSMILYNTRVNPNAKVKEGTAVSKRFPGTFPEKPLPFPVSESKSKKAAADEPKPESTEPKPESAEPKPESPAETKSANDGPDSEKSATEKEADAVSGEEEKLAPGIEMEID